MIVLSCGVPASLELQGSGVLKNERHANLSRAPDAGDLCTDLSQACLCRKKYAHRHMAMANHAGWIRLVFVT